MKLARIGTLFALCFSVAAPSWSQSRGDDVRILPVGMDWEQVITTTNPGSRSEGTVSVLRYRDVELAPKFEFLIIAGTKFDFVRGTNPWDFHGYRESETLPMEMDGGKRITEEELSRGWYESPPGERKAGTPKDWIHAGSDGVELVLDPEDLSDAADFYGIGPLPGAGGLIRQ